MSYMPCMPYMLDMPHVSDFGERRKRHQTLNAHAAARLFGRNHVCTDFSPVSSKTDSFSGPCVACADGEPADATLRGAASPLLARGAGDAREPTSC